VLRYANFYLHPSLYDFKQTSTVYILPLWPNLHPSLYDFKRVGRGGCIRWKRRYNLHPSLYDFKHIKGGVVKPYFHYIYIHLCMILNHLWEIWNYAFWFIYIHLCMILNMKRGGRSLLF